MSLDLVELPEDLYTGLVEAVKSHSITRLNEQLDLLAGVGDDGRVLALRLREEARKFNMKAIRSILDQIKSL